MSKSDEAVACFKGGFSCTQALLSTFSEELGMDRATACKVATGFGGGVGRTGNICGAFPEPPLSGKLTWKVTQPWAEPGDDKERAAKQRAQEMIERLKKKQGKPTSPEPKE